MPIKDYQKGPYGTESIVDSLESRKVISANTTLSTGGGYHISGTHTITLPIVSGLSAGVAIVMTKAVSSSPTIQVQGGSSEQILIGGSGSTTTDTSVVFDVNSEIVFVWNSNNWEV